MFYARLKKDIKVAVYYGDRYIQPNSQEYISFSDDFLKVMEQDERLDIKTEDEMKEITEEFNKKVEDTVNAHWRRAEKEVNESSDTEFLKAVKKLAINLGKKKVVQIVKDRMEELEIK